METKILLRNDSLWNRIQEFSLDVPNVDFPFSKKLAKEENWTLDFTKKAIEEYKKFVYLCCILPNGASPSEIVDKVWHMHMIYTQNYWEEFCPNILKRKLHHHPSTGGSNEKLKHQNWFTDTLKNYEEIFQQEAPEDIWKNTKPKPEERWFDRLRIFSLLFFVQMLNSCSDESGYTFFTIIFAGSVLSSFIFGIMKPKSYNNQSDPNKKGKYDDSSGGSCGTSCSSDGCGSDGGGCGGCGGD